VRRGLQLLRMAILHLGTGFLMGGFTARKQALHDLIADTLVVLA
jgi:uncharacterized RDD family membrane protein YckC